MKELILIRHAEAVLAPASTNDYERPLCAVGKRNAEFMAKELHKRSPKIDCFIYSGAKRTKETTEILNVEKKPVKVAGKLYEGNDHDYFEAVLVCSDKHHSVAVVGHNPGITRFVDDLLLKKPFHDMPATGICSVKIYADSWQDFVKAEKELNYFIHPD